MKICFPVQELNGIKSAVYGHFGSAPHFLVLNTNTNQVEPVDNSKAQHVHGACNPVGTIGPGIDAVVVGGIGAGAIGKLNAAGIKVFQAVAGTIEDNAKLIAQNSLQELTMAHGCSGHGGCH